MGGASMQPWPCMTDLWVACPSLLFLQYDCTPLYTASGSGHTTIVELLLAKGAAVNQAGIVSWSLHRESSFAIDLGLSSTEF